MGALSDPEPLSVQERVGDYLAQMAGARPRSVDIVFDEIGPPA